MPIFVLILVSAVALIAGLSVFFLRYLTEGRRLRAARAAVVLFDVLGVGAMLFLFASHRTEGWAGMLALPIFLGCVAQIIALFLTETIVVGLIGGVLGYGAGLALAQAIGYMVFHSSIAFAPVVVGLVAVLVILVVLGASIPAIRYLLRLNAAEVLHGR